jgi:hypothetical protein
LHVLWDRGEKCCDESNIDVLEDLHGDRRSI